MSSEQLLAGLTLVGLTMGLPTVLIGGALLGSRLAPKRRRWIERFVLIPIVVVAGLGLLAKAVIAHDWRLAGLAALPLLVALSWLRRRPAKDADQDRPRTD